jgi:drug/metabolite transporter (DMT)-like permease
VGYLLVSGKAGIVLALSGEQWAWALGTGFLLFGYVGTWYAALKRAPASLVTAILVVGAPITATFQALQKGAIPATPVLAGQLLIGAAAIALAIYAIRSTSRGTAEGASTATAAA